MKQVYKCEYCDEISENKLEIQEHEKICGRNPKNKIDDEIILKLSRLNNHVIESLIYILYFKTIQTKGLKVQKKI